jgi:hypothetical protein
MKRQAFNLIGLLSLLLVAGSAIAQSDHVRANIPFSFTVENKTLPAGAYDVEALSISDAQHLVLRSEDSSSNTIVGCNTAQVLTPANKTELVFDRYGDKYFLSEIWVQGATHGRHLPKSSREKELAREMARDRNQDRIEIVASLY